VEVKQFPGGDGELHDVGGDACRIGVCGNFCASPDKGLQFPIVQSAALHRNVVAGVAVLRFGEGLDDLRGGKLVCDLCEVERVATGRVVARKRECSDGVDKIAGRGIDV